MKLWMDIQRDLEGVMYDHDRILDAWRQGGVDDSPPSQDAVAATR